MNASGSPVQIESDDEGIRLVIDLGLIDDVNTLGARFVPDGEGVIRGRLDADAALALYEHIQSQLGEWAREGLAARRAVAAGVTREEYLGLGAPTDQGDEWSGEAMRDEGDRRRKEARENG